MCDCCREAAILEEVDGVKLRASQSELFNLLQNEVFLTIINDYGNDVWISGSNDEIKTHFKENFQELKSKIATGESAIRQLNSSWRVEEQLLSFRLVCHGSRIFIFLLDNKFKIVIINRNPPDVPFNDPPNFEKRFKSIIKDVVSSITVPPEPHNP